MEGSTPVLEARGVSKSFPGVRALAGVDFSLRAGEVHALMGGNGAGKPTLIKVLTGAHPPDAGEVLLDGRPIRLESPHRAPPPASAPSTRRSTSRRICRSRRTSTWGASRGGAWASAGGR